MYDLLFEQVSSEAPLTLKKERTSLERSIYDLRKKSAFNIKEVHNIVTNMHERRLCINYNGNDVIFPRMDEVKNVIAFFYRTYRGEGANKLVARVERCFIGISRQEIREYLARNADHTRKKPIFSNKAPLQPVVSHTVGGRQQIDLVSFEKYPQRKDGKIYCQVLSIMDVFSRYFWLRPLQSKTPCEVLEHIRSIYR